MSSGRDAVRLYREARARRIAAAREDPDAFVELAGIDSSKKDAPPIVQQRVHVQMQRDITEHPRVIYMTCPGMGKTTQLVLRIVWEIGRNPNIRVVIASKNKNKDGTGWNIFQSVRGYLEDPVVREVFPHLARGPIWQDRQLTVKRTIIDSNPTLRLGSALDPMKGARIDLFVLDDWYDERNTDSPAERKKLLKWFWAIQDRLSESARVVACCNAIHPDDPAHHIERLALERPDKFKWLVRRIPVYEPADYEIDLSKVRLTVPQLYGRSRVHEIRDSIPQLEFIRLYLCSALDEAGSVFDPTAVGRLFRPEEEPEGEGDSAYPEIRLQDQVALGCRVVIGVDLGAKDHSSADRTVLTAVAYWPREDVRQVIWIESGRWRSDIVAHKILDWDRRFRPAVIMVETSGQQQMMIGAIRLALENRRLKAAPGEPVPTPPVRGFATTKASKWDLVSGVETISIEIASSRWRFPALRVDGSSPIHDDLALLKSSLVNYVRGKHTGDHLMSLWLAGHGVRLIAYQEEEDRAEQEMERAMETVRALVRAAEVRDLDPDDIFSTDDAVDAWNALVAAGVDLTGYDDEILALLTKWDEVAISRSDEEWVS